MVKDEHWRAMKSANTAFGETYEWVGIYTTLTLECLSGEYLYTLNLILF
jgi:hypothetical protein